MKRTILLVEDDANDVFFMRRAMTAAGIINPLHVTSDGRQAMHYLGGTGKYIDREKFPLPCLVLLDLNLPVVMGLDVLQWIRAQPELTAVIVLILSSSNLATDINRAYQLGANSYLVKPSDPDKLQEILVRMKQYWLELNQSSLEPTSPPRHTRIFQSALF